jgi:dTDP-4-amino-4,6-dideoxygalactose transaminase
MNKPIPFMSLDYQVATVRREVNEAIGKVYDSGKFLLAKQTSKFEDAYAKFSAVRYCATVGNGHDAIMLALKAIGVGKGDEVIVPSNTCMPTWLAVTAVGARVVPVEPSIDTYNIQAPAISEAITSRTRAIVPVHLYGQACEMDSIMLLAAGRGLQVVEDNAQGHGASFNGQPTGSFGSINATSFYPTKNLGAYGDGGAITTNDADLYQKVVKLRNYGTAVKGIADERGINSRLDEMQAVVLYAKLKRLKSWNKLRKKIANYYIRELKGIQGLHLPVTAPDCDHVYHLFVVRTDHRHALHVWLKSKNIETMMHYPVPPHLQPAFRDHQFTKGQFPIAEEISETCLSLPCWPGMTENQCKQVVDSIQRFFASRN